MKFKAALAVAALVGVMAVPMTATAQPHVKKGDNGLHLGWYKQKNKKKAKKSVARIYDSRYPTSGRYDSRNGYPYDSRYDSRYGSRYPYNTQSQYDRRQQTKNEWRNIAYAAGALAILGILQKDNTLVFAGAAGALYSLHRYEQDRKSQNSMNRARARFFDHDHFYRDGVRYDRVLVSRDGQRYYQFVRR